MLRIWQVMLPTLSSQPSGITFASGTIALRPPHTNFAARPPCIKMVLPQLVRQVDGCTGAAQTRLRTEQRIPPAATLHPTLLPGIRKRVWASTGCRDGRNAVEGTFGRTFLITLRVRTIVRILILVLILVRVRVLTTVRTIVLGGAGGVLEGLLAGGVTFTGGLGVAGVVVGLLAGARGLAFAPDELPLRPLAAVVIRLWPAALVNWPPRP